MKRWRGLLVGMLLCTGAGANQNPTLIGRLFLGFQGQTPAPQVQLTLSGQERAITDDKGVFRLSLPAGTPPGQSVKLDIAKPGWCILSPFNGEVVVPAELGKYRPVEVRLLRSDSKQGTTQDCISRFIEAVANKPKSPIRIDQKPEPLDMVRELQTWAARQNFQITDEQARGELARWLAEVKAAPRPDPYTLDLARFADQQFGEARQLFNQAGDEEEKKLAEAAKQLAQGKERLVRDRRLAGDAARQELNFEAALVAYQKAHEQVSRPAQPELWAAILIELGITHGELGIRVLPERAHEHLAAAIFSSRQALQVYTREQLPQDWAMTQNNLGLVLRAQGILAAGGESQRLLGEAVQAYRQALQVYTREQLPQNWAGTQNNLGVALQEQGMRAAGEESQRLLGESVQAYRRALQVRTQDQLPQDWATTQRNLSALLGEQWKRATGEERQRLLGEAAQVYGLRIAAVAKGLFR